MNKIETSALLTIIGIIILFSTAIAVVLIAPSFLDPSWTQPTTPYQVQIYEVADPNVYISSATSNEKQIVNHLRRGYTLLAFQESETTKIIAVPELEKYITRSGQDKLILTTQLLLLRKPENAEKAQEVQKTSSGIQYEILELYPVEGDIAFSRSTTDGILENWVDENFEIIDDGQKPPYPTDSGVIYVLNPQEYRITFFQRNDVEEWRYNSEGKKIADLEQLKSHPLGFVSRQELIRMGEDIYKAEGCWYCHTDQTRTLVQDVVLNGSESYPAPPSSANEYIYQNVTFPGTKRNGPDISRVGVKRPSRDWHKGHFWSPKTASAGSIMPAFQHFFDNDPRGTGSRSVNFPNMKFEAIFQYLMTKGTRITPPTQAWWLGKDPIRTKEIIDGMRTLKKE